MEGREPFFEGAHECFVDECAVGREEEMLFERVGLRVPLVDYNVAMKAGHLVEVPHAM